MCGTPEGWKPNPLEESQHDVEQRPGPPRRPGSISPPRTRKHCFVRPNASLSPSTLSLSRTPNPTPL